MPEAVAVGTATSLANVFVSPVWLCVIIPPTVKSSVIVTSSGNPIVILPLAPTLSVNAISLVVPLKVTVVSVPELASKVITELFAPPAETGNV